MKKWQTCDAFESKQWLCFPYSFHPLLCNVVYLRHVNKQLGMFVTGEGTPLQTEGCRIPYAEEYLKFTFRLVRTKVQRPPDPITFSPILTLLTLFGRCPFRVLTRIPTILSPIEVFLGSSRQIHGHHRLILQFTIF